VTPAGPPAGTAEVEVDRDVAYGEVGGVTLSERH